MAVTIHRGISASDSAESVPKEKWSELVEMRRVMSRRIIQNDCRLILKYIGDAEPLGWLGYGSFDAYLRDGLQLDPQVVSWAVSGLEVIGADVPVPLARAVEVGRERAVNLASTAQPMPEPKPPPKHAGPGRGKRVENGGVVNTGVSDERGTTNADYLTRRIARDAPAVLDRMKAGEFKSVRAAAIEAGVVNPLKQLEQGAIRAVRKLGAEALDRVERAIAARRRELGGL